MHSTLGITIASILSQNISVTPNKTSGPLSSFSTLPFTLTFYVWLFYINKHYTELKEQNQKNVDEYIYLY